MKKTLLLTTALIGSLSVIGAAHSAVTIGAGVKTAWKTFENTSATGGASTGFTQERQIDLSSSGDLNNGLKFSAGFSLEQDGGETGFDGSEGNYVNVTSGNTTFELATDHAPLNGDFNIVPRAGNAMNEEAGGLISYSQSAGSIKENMGVSVLQKFDGGSFSINFVPKQGQKAEVADTATPGIQTGKRAVELAYFGQPAKNLDVYANYVSGTKDSSDTQDVKTRGLGLAYNLGAIKIGAERVNMDLATGADHKTTEYGAVYKISDNATIGIGHTKSEKTTTAGASQPDETINYLQVGYSLGAVGTQFSYISISDANNVAGASINGVVLKVNTKF